MFMGTELVEMIDHGIETLRLQLESSLSLEETAEVRGKDKSVPGCKNNDKGP